MTTGAEPGGRCASVDAFIAMKAAAGRTKDLRAPDDLEAIRQLDRPE